MAELDKKRRTQKRVIVPRNVTSLERGYLSSNVRIQSICIPSTVTCLGSGALEYCSALQSIIIPNSVTYIGADALNSCRSLKTVVIPDSVFAIRANAFENCTSLQSIIIPETVSYIEDFAFAYCTSLKVIVLPKEIMYFGRGIFDSCRTLDQRVIEGVNYDISTEKWLQRRFFGLPVHQACYENFDEMSIKEFALILEENCDSLTKCDAMGMTPLHILHGNPTAPVEVFRMLKEANSEAISMLDVDGMSPLMLLYACNSIKTSCYFDSICNGPSMYSMFNQGVRLECIEQLLQHDDEKILLREMREGDSVTGMYPFMGAASSSSYELDVVYDQLVKSPDVFHYFAQACKKS